MLRPSSDALALAQTHQQHVHVHVSCRKVQLHCISRRRVRGAWPKRTARQQHETTLCERNLTVHQGTNCENQVLAHPAASSKVDICATASLRWREVCEFCSRAKPVQPASRWPSTSIASPTLYNICRCLQFCAQGRVCRSVRATKSEFTLGSGAQLRASSQHCLRSSCPSRLIWDGAFTRERVAPRYDGSVDVFKQDDSSDSRGCCLCLPELLSRSSASAMSRQQQQILHRRM